MTIRKILFQDVIGIFFICAAFITISFSVLGENEQQNPTDLTGPALWSVADSDTTVYLFGVAELIPPGHDWRSDMVSKAFADADLVVLETDETLQAKVAPVAQQLGIFQNGDSLGAVLTDEQKQYLDAVTSGLGAPLKALDPLKPWLAAVQIGTLHTLRQGYQAWTGGLTTLASDAGAAGKPVHFIEPSRAVLLKIVSALPQETHIKMLMSSAKQVRENPTQTADIVPAWSSGDVTALTEFYHGEDQ